MTTTTATKYGPSGSREFGLVQELLATAEEWLDGIPDAEDLRHIADKFAEWADRAENYTSV